MKKVINTKLLNEKPGLVAKNLETARVWTAQDIMDYLGVAKPTAIRYMQQYTTNAQRYKVGHKFVWRNEDVEEMLQHVEVQNRIVIDED